MSKSRRQILDRHTDLGKYIADESCPSLYVYVGSKGTEFKFRKNIVGKTLWESIDDLYDEKLVKESRWRSSRQLNRGINDLAPNPSTSTDVEAATSDGDIYLPSTKLMRPMDISSCSNRQCLLSH